MYVSIYGVIIDAVSNASVSWQLLSRLATVGTPPLCGESF